MFKCVRYKFEKWNRCNLKFNTRLCKIRERSALISISSNCVFEHFLYYISPHISYFCVVVKALSRIVAIFHAMRWKKKKISRRPNFWFFLYFYTMIYRSILLAFARLLKFFLFFPLSVAMFLRLILLSIIIFEINYKVSGSENNGQQLSCDIILFFYSNTKMRQQKRKKNYAKKLRHRNYWKNWRTQVRVKSVNIVTNYRLDG